MITIRIRRILFPLLILGIFNHATFLILRVLMINREPYPCYGSRYNNYDLHLENRRTGYRILHHDMSYRSMCQEGLPMIYRDVGTRYRCQVLSVVMGDNLCTILLMVLSDTLNNLQWFVHGLVVWMNGLQ